MESKLEHMRRDELPEEVPLGEQPLQGENVSSGCDLVIWLQVRLIRHFHRSQSGEETTSASVTVTKMDCVVL